MPPEMASTEAQSDQFNLVMPPAPGLPLGPSAIRSPARLTGLLRSATQLLSARTEVGLLGLDPIGRVGVQHMVAELAQQRGERGLLVGGEDVV
jgi:hypothetical protein